MNAAIYARVSTAQQIDRDSLATQQERLKQFAAARGHGVFKVYVDLGVSAKNTNRPLLEELLADAEQGKFQYVLVTRLDRISRSLKDLLRLVEFFEERDIKLVSLTENIDTDGPMGRFIINLLGSVAQLEREIDAERVATDMHHRAEKGKWNGGPLPFGYLTREKYAEHLIKEGMTRAEANETAACDMPESKKLYPVEHEAAIVRQMFETYSRYKSLRRVVTELNQQGITTRKGPWTTTTVRRILTNPTYAGFMVYGKRRVDPRTGKIKSVNKKNWKVVPGEHEPLVAQSLFDQTQELLKQKSGKPSKGKNTYLLTGLLKCGHCGGMLHGYTVERKTKNYVYYRCGTPSRRGAGACKGLNVDGKVVEKVVIDSILKLSENAEFLSDKERHLQDLREKTSEKKQRKQEEKRRISKREKELISRRDLLLDKLETGVIDDETFTERFSRIKCELEEFQAVKAELETSTAGAMSVLTAVQTSYEQLFKLKEVWPTIDDEARRSRLQMIVKEVIVKKDDGKLKLDTTFYIDSVKEFGKCDAGVPMRALWWHAAPMPLQHTANSPLSIPDLRPVAGSHRYPHRCVATE